MRQLKRANEDSKSAAERLNAMLEDARAQTVEAEAQAAEGRRQAADQAAQMRAQAEEARAKAEHHAAELSRRLGQVQAEASDGEKEVATLREMLAVAESRIQAADAQTVATVDELKLLLGRKRAESESAHSEHEMEMRELQGELARLQRDYDEHTLSREDQMNKLRLAEHRAQDALQLQEAREAREVAALKQSLEQAEQMIATMRGNEVVQAEYSRATERVTLLEEARSRSERKVSELTAGITALKRQHAAMQRENAELQLVVQSERQANAVLNTARRDAGLERSGIAEQLASAQQEVAAVREQLASSERMREVLREEVDQVKAAKIKDAMVAEQVPLVERRLTEAQAEIRRLQADKESMVGQAAAAETRLAADLQRKVSQTEAEARAQIDALERKNTMLQRELADLGEASAASAAAAKQAAEAAVGEVAKGAADTTASLRAALEDARQKAEAGRTDLRAKELAAGAERQQLRDELAEASSERDGSDELAERLQVRLRAAEDELGLARNEAAVAAARAEHAHSQLGAGLRERDAELLRLRAALSAQQIANDDSKGAADASLGEAAAREAMLLSRTEAAEAQLQEERALWEQTVADLEHAAGQERAIAKEGLRRHAEETASADHATKEMVARVAELEDHHDAKDAELARVRTALERAHGENRALVVSHREAIAAQTEQRSGGAKALASLKAELAEAQSGRRAAAQEATESSAEFAAAAMQLRAAEQVRHATVTLRLARTRSDPLRAHGRHGTDSRKNLARCAVRPAATLTSLGRTPPSNGASNTRRCAPCCPANHLSRNLW